MTRYQRKKIDMRYLLYSVLILSISILLYTCQQSELKKGERLAQKYCAVCHLFPEPSLLDKKTWENGVMPKMAFRMGLDNSELYSVSAKDFEVVLKTIPGSPMLTQEEFDLITKYYRFNAPDSLITDVPETQPVTQFQAEEWRLPGNRIPQITLIKSDPADKNIWLGNRSSVLYKLGYNLQVADSFRIGSPASSVLFEKKSNPLVLAMGDMDPNDQPSGALVRLRPDRSIQVVLDSLKRPASIEVADLDKDGLDDYIVCAFGNYTGSLMVFKNLGGNSFNKYTLSNLPGARKTVVHDFDNDGLPDIAALITQGDEQVQLFLNSGNFNFRVITLLRFPPVYGSSYFELVDFNADGKPDILYSNGDNADFSITLKPYHGIRIFINQGGFQFEPKWFYPMHGTSQTIAHDFDSDGDIDIAAISFFPDFTKPENGFLYLENQNQGLSFKAFTSPLAANGRWLRMESIDLDEDQDMDLLLCALHFEDGVPKPIAMEWREKKTALLILRNQKH